MVQAHLAHGLAFVAERSEIKRSKEFLDERAFALFPVSEFDCFDLQPNIQPYAEPGFVLELDVDFPLVGVVHENDALYDFATDVFNEGVRIAHISS